MSKRILALVLSVFMVINFTACDLFPSKEKVEEESEQTTGETEISGEVISTSLLASNLKEKYGTPELRGTVAEEEEIVFDGYVDLDRNEPIEIVINTDRSVLAEEFGSVDKTAELYLDPQLTEIAQAEVTIRSNEDDPTIPEGNVIVTFAPLTPAEYMRNEFKNSVGFDMKIDQYNDEGYYAFESSEVYQWPVVEALYFVKHIEFDTLNRLHKSEVYKVNLGSVLEAPETEFYVNEEGQASLKWDRVVDAEYYIIAEKGFGDTLVPVDVVSGTNWSYHATTQFMNYGFRSTRHTDDELLDYTEEEKEAYAVGEAVSNLGQLTVVACSGYSLSPPGKFYDPIDYASKLPYSIAYNATNALAEEEETDRDIAPAISLIPMYVAISMADGTTMRRARIYDYDKAMIVDQLIFTIEADETGHAIYDEDGKPTILDSSEYAVKIPYAVEGTTFVDYVYITNYDEATYLEEVQAVKEYHEGNQSRGGSLEYTFDTEYQEEAPIVESKEESVKEESVKEESVKEESVKEESVKEESVKEESVKEESVKEESVKEESKKPATEVSTANMGKVFANSALSEYLAINMMSGNQIIDLSDFPESEDMEYLADALFEAMYQNPLVLGFASAGMLSKNMMIVEYSMEASKQAEMQKEILAEVDKIIGEVITSSMTDLEKEIAINNYLCANAVYDNAALENAEKNDFKYVDPKFDNSFNAYGILVDQVGVCASYAASFKLLADAAGLESIVVNGYLNGTLPHAWNRVNIDGEWHTIDVTNNDSEFTYNVLFNISDAEAAQVLVEDDSYIMNAYLGSYTSTHDDDEYYRITNQYFSTSDIATELVKELESTGTAVLRTDYELDDTTFYAIAQEVMQQSGLSDIYGYYWLGLICLTTETSK